MSSNYQSEDLPTLDKKTFCYDIETLKSYFSAAFIDANSDERYIFEVYRVKNRSVNQVKSLINFLKTKCKGLIGYNNLSFDYPVLHYLLEKENFVCSLEIEELLELIYAKAQTLISAKGKGSRIRKPIIPQLDLLEMNYYNSKARFVSLKQLEFVMRYENVQDMPYSHKFKIKKYSQAKEIADYNFNDVLATKMFYHKCKEAITLRKDLSKQYGIDLINHPETGLAKEAFAFELLKEMQITRQELNKMGTKREMIDVGKDVLLPFIEFKTPEFQGLLEFYKKQKITKLKGFFKDIDKKRAGYDDVIKHAFKEHIDKKTKTLSDLSVVFRDHVYVYGSGGIHSYFKGKVVKENDEWCILDVDVSSYYPNLSILFGFKPAHLGSAFMRIYNQIYEERKLFAKGTASNYIKKIQLNSSYLRSRLLSRDSRLNRAISVEGCDADTETRLRISKGRLPS